MQVWCPWGSLRMQCCQFSPFPTFIASGRPTGTLAIPLVMLSLRISSVAFAIPNTALPKATTDTFLLTAYSLPLSERMFWRNVRLFLTISWVETAVRAALKIVWASDFSFSWRSLLIEKWLSHRDLHREYRFLPVTFFTLFRKTNVIVITTDNFHFRTTAVSAFLTHPYLVWYCQPKPSPFCKQRAQLPGDLMYNITLTTYSVAQVCLFLRWIPL